jgi:hypothetical protein
LLLQCYQRLLRRWAVAEARQKIGSAGIVSISVAGRITASGNQWDGETSAQRDDIIELPSLTLQLKNFDRLVWLLRRFDACLPWPPSEPAE